ncbi:MAG: ATP-dependent Clp protease proteolytic subunit [Alphaproteobacteria bacterium]|nr:ATP-dependent Clp protease proteolytic subunit [Alphaproteobacteria bacterium]
MTNTGYEIRLDDGDENGKKLAGGSGLIDKHYFQSRIVMVTGEINHTLAERVCVNLLALANASDDPITVIISSPGGHVESGDMVHDTIKFIEPRVRVLGSGWVASAGALIYIAADKEDRYTLPNTRFLLHAPSGGIGGKATDIEIQAREISLMKDRLNRLFAEATGQDLAKIEQDTDRDFWLSASEAIEYGLATHIITKASELT